MKALLLVAAMFSATVLHAQMPAVNRDAAADLFRSLTGRSADGPERAALREGTPQARLAAALLESSELRDHTDFIVKCYLSLLGREPEAEPVSRILDIVREGADEATVLTGFLSTAEVSAAYPATLADKDFVVQLFRQLLGREPGVAEMDQSIEKLGQGLPRAALFEEFLRGAEYEQRIAPRVNAALARLIFRAAAGESAITR